MNSRQLIPSIGYAFFACTAHCFATEPIELEYDKSSELIVVEGTLNEKIFRFAVDSRSEVNAFGSHMQSELKPPFHKSLVRGGDGRSTNCLVCDYQPLKLGGVESSHKTQSFIVDLKDLQTAGQRFGCDGIVGVSFFWEKVLEIDPDRRLMRISDSQQLVAQDSYWVYFDGSALPYIYLNIHGIDFPFSVDTGSSTPLSVGTDVFANLVALGDVERAGTGRVIGIADGAEGREEQIGVLQELEFGGTKLANIPVATREGKRNVLGLPVLLKFKFALNLRESKLCLAPASGNQTPFKMPTIFDENKARKAEIGSQLNSK